MGKRVETIDFDVDPPRIIMPALIDKIRGNLQKCGRIHVFFSGIEIRVVRDYDKEIIENALRKDDLLGVHNKNEYPRQYIEKKIISDSKDAVNELYGEQDLSSQ
jgi:hypothetical protein